MARPKKTNIEIKELIEEYWINICDRNITKLKYTMIANYCKKRGIKIEAYDIRRSPEAIEYIESLKQEQFARFPTGETTIIFQTLDVNKFLEKYNDKYKLRKALSERDAYYADICNGAVAHLQQKDAMEKRLKRLKGEKKEIEESVTRLQAVEECLHKENKMLKEQCNQMMNILKTNVYPEIANELLRESKLLERGETIISDNGKTEILGDQDHLLTCIKKQNKVNSSSNILTDLFSKI